MKKSEVKAILEGMWVGGMQTDHDDILLEEGNIYYLGASSSPTRIVVTDVSPDRVTYYSADTDFRKPHTDRKNIIKDLIIKGTETYLNGPLSKYHPELASDLEDLLNMRSVRMGVEPRDLQRVDVKVSVPEGIDDPWRDFESRFPYEVLTSNPEETILTVPVKRWQVPELKDAIRGTGYEVIDVQDSQ